MIHWVTKKSRNLAKRWLLGAIGYNSMNFLLQLLCPPLYIRFLAKIYPQLSNSRVSSMLSSHLKKKKEPEIWQIYSANSSHSCYRLWNLTKSQGRKKWPMLSKAKRRRRKALDAMNSDKSAAKLSKFGSFFHSNSLWIEKMQSAMCILRNVQWAYCKQLQQVFTVHSCIRWERKQLEGKTFSANSYFPILLSPQSAVYQCTSTSRVL